MPEVITRQQVRQIILAATTQRMRVFFWTVYSMGLRLNEALHLQVGDVDSPRRLVHVHRGKGAKDRYVPISQFSVHHFLVTFTVPRELRSLLRAHQRAAYEALFQASAEALRQVAAATRSLKDAQLGFFGVLHTWGRDPMVYHPHVHDLVPGGGAVLDSQGKPIAWKSTPMNFLVHHGTLIRLYKAKLADALRAAGLYERVPCDVWTKNFVVDIQPVDDGRSTTPAGKNCG